MINNRPVSRLNPYDSRLSTLPYMITRFNTVTKTATKSKRKKVKVAKKSPLRKSKTVIVERS